MTGVVKPFQADVNLVAQPVGAVFPKLNGTAAVDMTPIATLVVEG